MSTLLPIAPPNFCQRLEPLIIAGGGVADLTDGDLVYAALSLDCEMKIVHRTAEELFEQTARSAQARLKLLALVNGNNYDVTPAGKADALVGHDPVPAKESIPLGLVVDNGSVVTGVSKPQRFYVAFRAAVSQPRGSYEFGMGDPPTQVVSALGGLGPLIINGVKYGVGNKYSVGAPPNAPATGEPDAASAPFLVQRNNNTYASLAALGPITGKAVIAVSTSGRKLLVVVQPDGVSGITLDELRDKLAAVGVDNAVFLDGSDSTMLMIGPSLLVQDGPNKDELNTVGVGFR